MLKSFALCPKPAVCIHCGCIEPFHPLHTGCVFEACLSNAPEDDPHARMIAQVFQEACWQEECHRKTYGAYENCADPHDLENMALEILMEYRDHYELNKYPCRKCVTSDMPARNKSTQVLLLYKRLCFGCLDVFGLPPRYYAEKLSTCRSIFRKEFEHDPRLLEIMQNMYEHDQRMLHIQHFLTVRLQVWVVG